MVAIEGDRLLFGVGVVANGTLLGGGFVRDDFLTHTNHGVENIS